MLPSARIFALVSILNLLDGIFTALFVSLGIVTEANPVMGWLLNYGLMEFMSIKVMSVNLFLLIMHSFYKISLVQNGINFIATVYSLINFYHLYIAICSCIYLF